MMRKQDTKTNSRKVRRDESPASNFERGAADADIEITRELPREEDREQEQVQKGRRTAERKTNNR